MKKSRIIYQESAIEQVFQKLISGWEELAGFYNKEVKTDDEDPAGRLAYVDIGDIARFIVNKKKSGQTESFETFFGNVEDVLKHGDQYVQELIVIGLFEGIQNIGGPQIHYYRSFDQWLKLNSLKAWRALIDSWEGTDWKKSDESQKIMNRRE